MQVLIGNHHPQFHSRTESRAASSETTGASEPSEQYQGATLFNDEPMNEAQLRTFAKGALIVGALGLTAAVATAVGVDAGVLEATSKVAHAGLIGGTMTGMVGLTVGGTLLRSQG